MILTVEIPTDDHAYILSAARKAWLRTWGMETGLETPTMREQDALIRLIDGTVNAIELTPPLVLGAQQ